MLVLRVALGAIVAMTVMVLFLYGSVGYVAQRVLWQGEHLETVSELPTDLIRFRLPLHDDCSAYATIRPPAIGVLDPESRGQVQVSVDLFRNCAGSSIREVTVAVGRGNDRASMTVDSEDVAPCHGCIRESLAYNRMPSQLSLSASFVVVSPTGESSVERLDVEYTREFLVQMP